MTVPNKEPKVYGFSALKITKMLTDVAGAAPTYDDENSIVIRGAVNLKYDENVQEVEGRGDERILEVEYKDDKAGVTWETLYFPMEAAKMVNGGTVVTGTDDVEYFGPGPDEIGEYFKIEGLSKDKKVKQTYHKVKGRIKLGGFTGGDFVNATFDGTAIHTTGDVQGKPRRVSVKQSSTPIEV